MKLSNAVVKYPLVALALALTVACGSDDHRASTDSDAGSAPLKVLRLHRSSAHKTLDPMKQFDQASANVISNLFDTLIEYHYLDRPYRLIPGILATMPERQADGVTYKFVLKKGVYFVDDPCFPGGKGREVTIDDVIFTLKRFADANVNILSYSLIQGFVVGIDEYRAETKHLGKSTDYDTLNISGVLKVDDYTMTVRFTADNPLALFPFAFSGMSILAREAVEEYGEDFGRHPVGTGPFYMKQQSRRGEMILAKNPDYHQTYPTSGEPADRELGLLADAGKKLPLIDVVRLPLIEESQPAMLKFKKGEIDWIGMNKDDFVQMAYRDDAGRFHLKGEYATKYEMYTEPGLYAGYVAFNMKDSLFGKNKALRQAFAYAMSTKDWIDLLHNGRGMPLNTIVPHPIAGSETDIDFKYYQKDVEMARKKLGEAGFPEGKGLPEITIDFRSTTKDMRQSFEFMRNELAMVNIKVKANFQTFSAFLTRIESGNFQIAEAAWGADYPDGENFYQLLYGPNRKPGPNMSMFDNPEYDQLYEQSKFMPNGPERFELFRRMSEIIMEEVPLILRNNRVSFGLYQPRLSNMKRNMMVDVPYKYLNLR